MPKVTNYRLNRVTVYCSINNTKKGPEKVYIDFNDRKSQEAQLSEQKATLLRKEKRWQFIENVIFFSQSHENKIAVQID